MIRCSEGCCPDTDTPFVYPPIAVLWATGDDTQEPEQGVLSDSNGEPVNRWEDGIAGVPEWVRVACRAFPEWPDCIECGAPAENA